jgi:hypothetical protein
MFPKQNLSEDEAFSAILISVKWSGCGENTARTMITKLCVGIITYWKTKRLRNPVIPGGAYPEKQDIPAGLQFHRFEDRKSHL